MCNFLSSLALTQPKEGLRGKCVQGKTQGLFNFGRRVHMYLSPSSDRVRRAPYQRVAQPKNTPVSAPPVTAEACGHRKRAICQREFWKTCLLKHHRKSSNKIGSALSVTQLAEFAHLNLGFLCFDFILVGLVFSSLLLILKRHLMHLAFFKETEITTEEKNPAFSSDKLPYLKVASYQSFHSY